MWKLIYKRWLKYPAKCDKVLFEQRLKLFFYFIYLLMYLKFFYFKLKFLSQRNHQPERPKSGYNLKLIQT